ncbi:MAG: Crp/Fnr family transcriptional regulator [Marinobacter sp.]|uniref:Crp/Fnr family transcriptional regulator n=1 Tax=Marinobacter sp. TaxID=50741 RepID=UPI00349FE11F
MARALIQALTGNVEFGESLSAKERLLLNSFPPQKLEFEKNTVVFREGEPANQFLLVEKGVCFTHRHLEDGSRQIIEFYFPREVVALGELSKAHHSAGLMTLSDTVLAVYDKDEITQGFSESPELSRLFIRMISKQQANLTERLVGLTRYSARQRMAHFLLEVDFRLKRSEMLDFQELSGKCSQTVMPEETTPNRSLVKIPQVLIADSLGLSIVHVNRILRQLREQGCIATRGYGIELSDIKALKGIAGWAAENPTAPKDAVTPAIPSISVE